RPLVGRPVVGAHGECARGDLHHLLRRDGQRQSGGAQCPVHFSHRCLRERRMKSIAILFISLLSLTAVSALAQEWPARPVRIIVPSAPGGGTDFFARLMGSTLSDALKGSFVVENRPGGNGNIGADVVAKAPPDGYTILITASPALIMNPTFYSKLPFNVEKDFAPVHAGVVSPLLFVVHPSVPARTLAELVEIG